MPTITGNVITDFDSTSSTNTVLIIRQSPTFSISYDGFAIINTTIPEGTIDSATLHWYDHSYSVIGKSTTYQGEIQIYDYDTSTFHSIYSFNSSTPISTGWKSVSLPSGTLQYVRDDSFSNFKFLCANPGSTNSRTWEVRANEYSPIGTFSAYLVIDYSVPIPAKRRIFIF